MSKNRILSLVVVSLFILSLALAALRGFHMLEPPSAWLKRPDNLAKVLRYWATRSEYKADAYPPKPGPSRIEMFQALGIPADADLIRA